MIRRYVASGYASYVRAEDSRLIHTPSIDVFSKASTIRHTGLLDAAGNPILVEERQAPIGFVHFGDAA